jgi:hypothetical protein
MDLIDIIAGAQGGRGLESLGRQFGLDDAQTRAALEALAPVVAAGISRNTGRDGGLGSLIGALSKGNHGRYLDEPLPANATDDGNAILGHIFGSKEVSRGVAQRAAGMSGLGESILKKMLPVIATMVMGALAKRMMGGGAARADTSGGGGLGDILKNIFGGGPAEEPAQAPRRQAPTGGGLEDILKDILGGGGAGAPMPRGGGPGNLDDLLKEIFGQGGARTPTQDQATRRGREAIDDALGRRQRTGNAADDMLSSVEDAIRRRM